MRWAIVWFAVLATPSFLDAQSPRASGRERGDYPQNFVNTADRNPAADRGVFPGGYNQTADLPDDSFPSFDAEPSGQPSFIPASQADRIPPGSGSQTSRDPYEPSGDRSAATSAWPGDAGPTFRNEAANPIRDQPSATRMTDPLTRQSSGRPVGSRLEETVQPANPASSSASRMIERAAGSGTVPGNQDRATGVANNGVWPDTGPSVRENGNELKSPRQEYSLTVLLLFGSIGLNVYLFWITWDTYNRYQDLLGDLRSSRNRRDTEMSIA